MEPDSAFERECYSARKMVLTKDDLSGSLKESKKANM